MSTTGEHLSQENLSEKAMEILKELEDLLQLIKFKPERNNLHCCNHQPALFNIVKRLTEELEFITVKDPIPPYNAFRVPFNESDTVEPPTIRIIDGDRFPAQKYQDEGSKGHELAFEPSKPEVLCKSWETLSTGYLLHGPPGTGKSNRSRPTLSRGSFFILKAPLSSSTFLYFS